MKKDLAFSEKYIVSIATALLTVSALVLLPGFTDIAKSLIYMLDILALYYLIRHYGEFGKIGKLQFAFFLVIVFNFIWIVFTYYINGDSGREDTLIWNRQLFLLFIIPLYYLYREFPVSPKIICLVFVVSILISFGVAIDDISEYESSKYQDRAHGGMHPLQFGYLLFTMVAYLSYTAIYQRGILVRIILSIAIIIALTIIIWTQSRGVWIALPVIPLLALIFASRKFSAGKRTLLFLASLAMIGATYMLPVVKDRVDVTIENVQSYLESSNRLDEARLSSLGGRLEMWKAGWKMFLEHPLTGVGIGRFQETARQNAERYQVGPSAYRHYNAHSEYITALATRGIPGFCLVLALMVLPILIVRESIDPDASHRRPAEITVLTIAISFGIFGLTDNPFESKPTILFYSLVMALFLASLEEKKDKPEPETGIRSKHGRPDRC